MPEIKETNIQNEQENRQTSTEVVTTTERRTHESVLTDVRETSPRVPHEVKSWMQKLEEDPSMNQNNTGAKGGDDSVLKTIAPAVTKITLPTNRTTFSGGFVKPVDQAWRWLSEFVLRIIKKNEGKVKFKEE